mgnify:CR=1 FL=1
MYKTAAVLLFAIAQCANNFNPGFNCTLQTDLYCNQCNSDIGGCTLCSFAYLDSKYKSCRLASYNITNCVTYKSHNECDVCDFSFQKQDRGSCQRIVVSSNSTCYSSNGSSCQYCTDRRAIPDAQGNCNSGAVCTVPRCDLCSSDNKCDKCLDGYVRLAGECIDQDLNAALANCQSATVPFYCDICLQSYVSSNGSCIKAATRRASQLVYDIMHPAAADTKQPPAAILGR